MAIDFDKMGYEEIMVQKIQGKMWIEFVGGGSYKGELSTLL
jgi:hypothetical protein